MVVNVATDRGTTRPRRCPCVGRVGCAAGGGAKSGIMGRVVTRSGRGERRHGKLVESSLARRYGPR